MGKIILDDPPESDVITQSSSAVGSQQVRGGGDEMRSGSWGDARRRRRKWTRSQAVQGVSKSRGVKETDSSPEPAEATTPAICRLLTL